jgi:hypothetical protein
VFLASAVSIAAAPATAATLCGILDGPGCVPTVCSVLDPQTCIADEDFPMGGDLRLTIATQSAEAAPPKPDHDLNTLRNLFFMLRACWAPPAIDQSQRGMQMTVRVSYRRSGEMIASPQLTYALPGTSQKVRETYRNAIGQSLSACAPLHFTKGFAGAIAGRPIMIRYVDDRTQ